MWPELTDPCSRRAAFQKPRPLAQNARRTGHPPKGVINWNCPLKPKCGLNGPPDRPKPYRGDLSGFLSRRIKAFPNHCNSRIYKNKENSPVTKRT